MRRTDLLKGLIAVQAACMIVVAVVVLIRLLPVSAGGAPAVPPAEPEPAAPDGGAVVGQVGGKAVTKDELLQALEQQFGKQVLYTLMVRRAIDLEAEAVGLSVSAAEVERELARMIDGYASEADFYQAMEGQLGLTKEQVAEDAKYRLLLEQIAMRAVEVGEAEVDAYIDSHPARFAPDIRVDLAWILTETPRLAEQAVGELEDGASFAALARRYSMDEYTAEIGGEIGQVDLDDPFVDPAVLEAAAELEVGAIAGPLVVDDGYAVIRLNERTVSQQMDETRIREAAFRLAALSLAPPLHEVERDLLLKYEAQVLPPYELGN
ncbi:peptidyl-prolyl cis-trans isomerase [Paenibacillus sp. IB182496]|uniref:Peptidyl-prolyl cis-trans isomerase n=1 Tax=Paenibacillus sabuli TaxID=2772509 RepID=A0A927BZ47_9BACL|nr:peptidyl-prolyl cis-trans isomerase [Paenibacillus sabuli]MBD2848405.1 peptidyl-prolyl cis-trans isomerase [Paenibacillus sabuli]